MTILILLFQVILIDVCLSGDNAVVIAMAANGLEAKQRQRAIVVGIGFAIVLRTIFSIVASKLMGISWITLSGGVALLWICYKMFCDIRSSGKSENSLKPARTLMSAVWTIAAADAAMSIDNVLAVAGASHGHIVIMTFGLVFSIVLMAVAADLISRILAKWHWLNYIGLLLIIYVSLSMIYRSLGSLGWIP